MNALNPDFHSSSESLSVEVMTWDLMLGSHISGVKNFESQIGSPDSGVLVRES